MIPSVSSLIFSAAAADVKAPPDIQRPEGEDQDRSQKPVMDEYAPGEKREPSGLYWVGRDGDGQPKVYFDDPEKEPSSRKTERCTCNTDQVDRELETLRQKRKELKQQLSSQADARLAEKLAQVERALALKDNDAYRRQHAVLS